MLWAVVLPCVALIGCGGGSSNAPELGYVEGTVTLEGTPLAGATLTFQPEEGRPSTGTTDEKGDFELLYTSSEYGAKIGKHRVTITTYNEGGEDDPDDKPQPEKVPAKYQGKDAPIKHVKEGRQTIDFALEGGKVVQPEE